MVKGTDVLNIDRFGGPGSSHQDREHPGLNGQPNGHKSGGGERDRHHTRTEQRS